MRRRSRTHDNTRNDAGVKGLGFDDLRYTAATRVIEAAVPPLVAASRVLGHQHIHSTMPYSHPEDSLRDAVERLVSSKGYSKKYTKHPKATEPLLNKASNLPISLHKVVGVAGLEPAASASRTQRSANLSYTPTLWGNSEHDGSMLLFCLSVREIQPSPHLS